ncbi:MAG: hypothetical protein LBL06_02875 [Treponema sp.]|jgi:hypothetical protein|nr:hypothetical protein [Treponema sp.]
MDTIITLKAGQEPTKDQIEKAEREYAEAVRHDPVYDEDCPASTPEVLAEFAAMARELWRNRRKTMPSVTSASCLNV